MQLSGELDIAVSTELRDDLARAKSESSDVIVDVHEVGFIGCVALGTLVQARNEIVAAGGDIVLRGPRPRVRRLITLAGLSETFPTRPERFAADEFVDEVSAVRRSAPRMLGTG